jgi:hypothetical protein
MKKFLIITLLIVIIAAAGSIYVFQKRQQATTSTTSQGTDQTTPTPTTVPQELILWQDPNGFTFQYPKDAEVNKHDEDTTNYAHIELTHKNHPGGIIIWAKDTAVLDGAAWVKSEKTLVGGTVFDTTLGGISGKKVLLTTPRKLVVSAIVDSGVVFYVEGAFEDSEYWSKAYDAITTSFSFQAEKPSGQQTVSSEGEGAVDEEEIVE